MQCPVCSDKTLVMSERQGIEIDYCPGCRGVWLDRGELDKIIERAAAEQRAEPAPAPAPQAVQPQHAPPHYPQHHPAPPQGQYPRDDYYKQKRRKSFLEDLFD